MVFVDLHMMQKGATNNHSSLQYVLALMDIATRILHKVKSVGGISQQSMGLMLTLITEHRQKVPSGSGSLMVPCASA